MKEIKLSQNKVALVDDKDYEELSKLKWYAQKDGKTYYAMYRSPSRKCVAMHRGIMNPNPGFQVDHIDGNGLNNIRENLRVVTHRQNCYNRHFVRSESGYKGVFFRKNRPRKWIAMLIKDGKTHLFGCFKSKRLAAVAYNIGALKYFGEFASLNPIKPED